MNVLQRILERINSIKYTKNFKPVDRYSFQLANRFTKQDVFSALFYLINDLDITAKSRVDFRKVFELLVDMGLHPLIVSCFFHKFLDITPISSVKCHSKTGIDHQSTLSKDHMHNYEKSYKMVVKNKHFAQIDHMLRSSK